LLRRNGRRISLAVGRCVSSRFATVVD
jgi:hypothetical protein